MEEKDYYKILGITDDEKKLTGDEFSKLVSKKFKTLALKYHPDRHVNDSEEKKKEAEAKFKEINEANAILSDPEKRQQYDNGGADFSDFFKHFHGGFDGDFDPFGGFGSFFSGGRQSRERVVVGEDATVKVNISMEEAFNGGEKEISYYRDVPCPDCQGTGSSDGKITTCPHCHGTGMITKTQNRGNVFMQQSAPCPHCHGTGKMNSSPCKKCHGSELIRELHKEIITIPAGIASGQAYSIEGLGHFAQNTGAKSVPGNLNVIFNIEADSYFNRVDQVNVVHTETVDFTKCLLGFKQEFRCVDGTKVTVNAPECTPDNKAFIFHGKGFPHPNTGKRGDYAVVIKYSIPNKLNKAQRSALESFNKLR